MTRVFNATASSNGFTVKAYTGDRCVMLAFDLSDHLTDRLAGFAIRRRIDGSDNWVWLGNRLSFDGDFMTREAPQKGKFFPSNVAPFQKFWWLDFPPDDAGGTYCYEVVVKRFVKGQSADLTDDQHVQLTIDVGPFQEGKIEVAFTRGYLSSQAYADRFDNAPYQPKDAFANWDFDAKPYLAQWEWLGAHARRAIVDFLNECHSDESATLDAFVYDLNEPEIIEAFAQLAAAGKLRLLADDSRDHAAGTVAAQAFEQIVGRATAETKGGFMRGHFKRYQHNKVLIKRTKSADGKSSTDGTPVKVLTGSTNFSITGLYVNANHVVVFNDEKVAAQYGDAFDAALKDEMKGPAFYAEPISKQESPVDEAGMPSLVFSFAPHKLPDVGLKRVLDAIKAAESSVIFAVMDLNGKGEVLAALSKLHADRKVFSYGISDTVDSSDDTVDGATVFTPSSKGGELIYSKADPEHFPAPFSNELQVHGPAAHVVHHKFVVVDFNGTHPVVFGGSSNLAEGGEECNGDNLFAIYDRAIATAFAIEGIRLVDHYAFAEALKKAGNAQHKLRLKFDDEKWWSRYYTPDDIREKERLLFAR